MSAVVEALHAGASPWQVARLGGLFDASAIDAALRAVAAAPWALVVVSGRATIDERGLPALRCAASTWAFDIIASALGTEAARQAVVVVAVDAAQNEVAASAVARAIEAVDATTVVAVDATSAAIDALVRALHGRARAHAHGAISPASLAAYLDELPGTRVRVVADARADAPWFEPPPLERLWQLGWSTRGLALARTEPRRVDGAEGAAGEDPLIGRVLPGRFRVDARLAEGSFGVIYRARQLAVDRDVAIKLLRNDIDPFSEDGRLFVHEIQAVARIDHRNVVRVFQADVTADGRMFFAMELLAGRDLQQTLDAGAIEPARAVALVLQLLAALAAAHAAGLVHADVKPGNAVLVDEPQGNAEPRLVLVDFGLSRLWQPARVAISAGGTPVFMAPEQLRAGRVDARSDQFAAALVLVLLLTGWRRRRASELAPEASTLALIEDVAVRAAVARALAIEPDARFGSVSELAAALANTPAPEASSALARPPFHGLASFTEEDNGRLHGRDAVLAQLSELALYRSIAIVTAPSGVGKTSVLRAGLLPRLAALAVEAHYASCRVDDEASVVAAISAKSTAGVAAAGISGAGISGAGISAKSTAGGSAAGISAESTVAISGAGISAKSMAGISAAEISAQSTSTVAGSLSVALGARDSALPVVLVIDQIEDALERPAAAQLVRTAVELALRNRAALRVVLGVREDYLARVLDRLPERGDGAAFLRIGPLDPDGARDAIVRPLAERRLAIESALLERLLADLVAAGRQLGAELGWTAPDPIYPPHLQLACSVLYARLPSDTATITLAHYQALGGFSAIVGEHLERVLDELSPDDSAIARALFLALVTAGQLRSARTEASLVDDTALPADALPGARNRIPTVLEQLRRQGLVVRSQCTGGELVWELIHDSLVPRVLAWIDRHDLSRRRALEMLRHHLRRSAVGAPSLLSRAELREVDAHPGVALDLDAERISATTAVEGVAAPGADDRVAASGAAERTRWTAVELVTRSRVIQRRSRLAAVALIVTVIAGVTLAAYARWQVVDQRRAEADLRDLDLGVVTLELAPFDWDPATLTARPVPYWQLPALQYSLHAPSFDDPDSPGEQLRAERVRRIASTASADGFVRRDTLEVPGGNAFVVITGRRDLASRGLWAASGSGAFSPTASDCGASVIPLRNIPGYARRGLGPRVVRLVIPTCQATYADTIEIPAGPFIFGGVGEPRYSGELPGRSEERVITLRSYRLDRTEVTNAAYSIFATMHDATTIATPDYIPTPELSQAALPRCPVSAITWSEARAYCRFLGRGLPTSEEWEKGMRGGLAISGKANPYPRRNFPWGIVQISAVAGTHDDPRGHQANLADESHKGIRLVSSFAQDESPYGVVDMAGNVLEWIGSAPTGELDPSNFFKRRWRLTRGANWSETSARELLFYMPIENARPGDTRSFTIGVRCVAR